MYYYYLLLTDSSHIDKFIKIIFCFGTVPFLFLVDEVGNTNKNNATTTICISFNKSNVL